MTVARRVPDNLPACSIETSLSAPVPVAVVRGELDAPPPASDYSNKAVFLGRLKPDRARESHRVVHVFPLATEGLHATTTLIARCGERLLVADIQWLPRLLGMPCDHCLLHSLGMDGGPQITDRVG